MIVVESPGLLTTVQDLGRPGYGALGISPSGAADPLALRIANLLVGNAQDTPALEMTVVGGRYRFTEPAWIAITGARSPATTWRAMSIERDGTVEIGAAEEGARIYLAVRGGLDVPRWLGSASSHLMSGLGPPPLKRGDRVAFGQAPHPFHPREVRQEVIARLSARKTLRITYGPQIEQFGDRERAKLVQSEYRVAQQSDRLGIRLEGPPLSLASNAEMITEGAPLGAIQVPANGQPIILFIEQQTTGGYPKIANVVSADLASLGQLRPCDAVRFEWVSLATARALLVEQESLLRQEALFV